jgi:hypothetical protein
MKRRYTFLAWLAVIVTVPAMFFLFSLVEVILFKPHELGALLGTAFVYGRLVLLIWIARFVFKKVKGLGAPKPEIVPSRTISPLASAIERCDD